MISVSELTRDYGPVRAVDHISFDVDRGQIVGFLGPNGSGKSTTLRMLTCYLPPTSGTATVNGYDIFHQSEQVRANLGYLPESCPLYTEMKVDEYLDFRGRLRGMDRDGRRRRIDYVVERCWLSNVRTRLISHLSKGYRQRVGLADSMLHDPAVLILDEPTVGLDPNQINETRKLIKELGGDHTVILSTHILPEVEEICNHVIIIARGRIAQDRQGRKAVGSPTDLRRRLETDARVLVECKGPAAQVKTTLEKLGGVGEVELLNGDGAADKAYVTAAVRPKGAADVREEVARAVVQNGWPLREVRLENATLEEFFVRVTADQAAANTGNGNGAGRARVHRAAQRSAS